jgi:peptide/nickel transport system substrate-binding protein
VIFKEIKEANTRMAALRAGEADVINGISPDQEEALARDPNVVISRKGPAVMTRYLLFNNGRKPFDDKRVRQATFMATDREGLAKTVLRGRGMVGKAPISPAVFGHNPNLKPWPYDPERAKKMLAEAGYPNGFTVTLMQWAGNLYTADDLVAQALIEQLGNVGITVKLDVKEVQTGVAMLIAHNYDFNIAAWVPMTADGDQALFSPYRSIPGGNRSFYKNEEVDRLLDEGRASPDQTQREKVYLRAQELLWEDVPYAWLFHDVEALAMRKNLKGVVARPDNMVRLFEAAIE